MPGDENPYSYCNSVHLSKEMALLSTHYSTTSVTPKIPSIIWIGKRVSPLNYSKGEYIINPYSFNNQGIQDGSPPSIEPTLQERQTWEEIVQNLDELRKASSFKTFILMGTLAKSKNLQDKNGLSNIYLMAVKLIDYGIREFGVDDIIFNITMT